MALSIFAQDDLLARVASIKPFVSSRSDVQNLLGKGSIEENSVWYYGSEVSIGIDFSNGKCSGGWLVPKDKVVEITVNFLEYRKLSELKKRVDLSKLRKRESLDNLGEKYYFDDQKGIKYGINQNEGSWFSVWYFPSKEYANFRCVE
jgi:hypothetical protein